MKKINNKGFVLVETLIVSAFVVSIFSIMYANFYPMMGEYEKRENYDDINSIYNAYLIKRMLENYKSDLANNIECNDRILEPYNLPEGNTRDYFLMLEKYLNIDKVYFTYYNLASFKEKVMQDTGNNYDVQTKEYIDYLPNYGDNPNNLSCRIIVKYKADANKESNYKSGEFKFATIGVDY